MVDLFKAFDEGRAEGLKLMAEHEQNILDKNMRQMTYSYMEERMAADWSEHQLPIVKPEGTLSIFFCPLCSVKLIERDSAFWCENQGIKFDVYLGLHNSVPQIVMKSV